MNGSDDDKVYLISGMLDACGLEGQTIRFYEQEGLIYPKRSGRTRLFTARDIEHLKAIKLLRDFDVPLREIKALVDAKKYLTIKCLLEGCMMETLRKRAEEQKNRSDTLMSKYAALQESQDPPPGDKDGSP